MRIHRAVVGAWAIGLSALVAPSVAQEAGGPAAEKPEVIWPGMTRAGTIQLPNGWSLNPAGRQLALGDFPVLMAECPTAPVLAVLHAGYGEHEVITLDVGPDVPRVVGRVALPSSFSGLAWSPDGKRLFVGGGFDDVVYRFDHAEGLLSNRETFAYPDSEPGRGERRNQRTPAGLALSADGSTLWVAEAWGHAVARFDAETGRLIDEIALGDESYPFAVALDEPRGRAYVSLWGAAKVAAIDAKAGKVVAEFPTEEHPNELLIGPGGKVLYAANANRNTVTVVDLESGRPLSTIGTAIDPRAPAGCTPGSLALTPDGAALFVANANTNDLAAVNVTEPGASTPLGFIPTGWYPTAVRVARDGKRLFVANGKGASSKANRDGPNPVTRNGPRRPTEEYIGGLFRGTLSAVPMPGPSEMAAFTRTVYECSPLNKDDPAAVPGPAVAEGNPIPRKVGDPSPITHCVYVIKENRTYDQVFGDMAEGNGEPALCIFPEEVTPNHHALAREFVLLDNFYVESEVSADGHEWTMGAYATDFVERTWPLSYRGDRRVAYPAEGSNLRMATPAGGYLWDRAAAKGVSYRSYGEFVDNGPTPDDPATTKVPALEGHFDPMFRSYDLSYPDVKRTERFLEELAGFEAKGEMPRLIVLRLPNDHTSGTRPGVPTPTAMVAENDQALGRLVEGLAKSRFWPKLAIFVVEDDAQNGSDHVDAHRTVALAISPYVRRKAVDSTLYTTSSMLRTMELVLGLDPMSQFDAAARPMYAAFGAEPDLTPYVHRPARVDLDAKNTAASWGAALSEKLDLAKEDAADDLMFNEIIWKSVRGADSTMPPPVRAAFVLPTPESEGGDDD